MAGAPPIGVAVEVAQVVVLAGVLVFLSTRARKEGVSGEAGWNWILSGLWILVVWSILDVLDNVPAVASDPTWTVVDDLLVDLLPAVGALALAAGLAYWVPYPARLEELTGTLEERVEDRTAELAESEARFRAIAENIDAAVWLAELGEGSHDEAEIIYLGPGYEDLLDQPREAVEEAPFPAWLERVHPDDRERVQRDLEEVGPSDPRFEVEYRVPLSDGGVRWLRTEGFPVEGAEADRPLLAGLTQDITARKEREEALEDARRYLDRVMDAFPDVVYVLGPDGVLRRWNDSLAEVTGYPDDEIGSMHATEFFSEEEQPRIAEAISETFETGWTRIEAPFLTADGETIPYEFHSATTTAPDGETVLVGTGRDISARREREERLQQVRTEYESIFQNVQDALWLIEVHDDELRFERFNPTQEELTGLSTEEVQGKTPEEAFGPELAREVEPNYRECIDRGEPLSYEEELAFDGETRIFQTRLTPVLEDGEVVEIVGSARDVTEARRYEERLRDQRDQLEILNRLVRHDIKNDMTAVLSVADMLRADAPEVFQEDLEQMIAAGEHVVELTETARALVDVIRQGEVFRTEPTPLAATLEGEVEHVRGLYEDARFEIVGEIPDVEVQAGPLLSSVFRNILNNAVLHNDKETPKVRVDAALDGDEVEVRISDNGPGVPEAVRESIFEAPDDALDPDSSMGMYLVQRVVSAYGGSVRVEDNEPEGAVFVVTLQLADGDG